MIKSEMYKGQIYAGKSSLECTMAVEQTAPMELTVRKGKFANYGHEWVLKKDRVFKLASSPKFPTEVALEIGDINGMADVHCASRVLDGKSVFDFPEGWKTAHSLIVGLVSSDHSRLVFVVPPKCADLTPLDIFVLSVVPGFPEGTTAADWKIQVGK